MSALNPRPILFPLSNPVRLSECEFHEAVEWSKGTVLFASGSPFPEEEYNGRMLYPGQGECLALSFCFRFRWFSISSRGSGCAEV